jgi:hypothetical protein
MRRFVALIDLRRHACAHTHVVVHAHAHAHTRGRHSAPARANMNIFVEFWLDGRQIAGTSVGIGTAAATLTLLGGFLAAPAPSACTSTSSFSVGVARGGRA